MGWEKRKRSGLYYTRSIRRNGRVIRQYIGCGAIGQMAAAQDARRRAERCQRAEAIEVQKRRLEGLEETVEMFCRACDLITKANLLPGGIHYDRKNRVWRTRKKSHEGTAP